MPERTQGYLLEVNPLFKVDQWRLVMLFDVLLLLKDSRNIVKMYFCAFGIRQAIAMSSIQNAYHAMEYSLSLRPALQLFYMCCN